MLRITPQIKEYAWGSRDSLARLAGHDQPADAPQAELWVGAHEAGPATLDDGSTLDAHIAGNAVAALSEPVVAQFGERLPFLLKILAAEKALSIQAHPAAVRAASAPEGTYADSWPKPEAWIPLTNCVAFAGSLPFDVASARLRGLDVPALTAIVDAAAASERPAHALLAGILGVPSDEQPDFVAAVMAAVREAVGADRLGAEKLDTDIRAAWQTALEVLEQFPGDIGVIVTLTMGHLIMKPGKSYFIDAGVLHSFVRGTTVEILANSDNVVRAGLTPKKIDVPELLEIVDETATITAADPHVDGAISRFESKVPHFCLHELTPSATPLPLPGRGQPVLVLALDAPVTLTSGDEELTLGRLEAAWCPADTADVQVTGQDGSRLFVASVNTP